MSEIVVVDVGKEDAAGLIIRLAMMMTHYRKPIDWSEARKAEAEKMFFRWTKKMVPCGDAPPTELIEALSDDLNTPKAIQVMNGFAKSGNGKKLYASMSFLGLLPNIQAGEHQ